MLAELAEHAAGAGGTVEEQVARLKERIGAKGVKQPAEILEGYSPDVIRYAFRMLPKAASVTGLGSRIETILAAVPPAQRDEMRATLLAAKRKTPGK